MCFQTDAAGRTIYTSEPERGGTTYSYAYNATGLQVTRVRPQANQTNSSVTTSTVTQYDSLGRPVTVAYNDGVTPGKDFYYDTNPYASWSSETTTNLKGNLAIASTFNPGTLLTSSLYSYDLTGRVTTMWQCTPSICGTPAQTSRPPLTFAYDLAGNLINEFDSVSGNLAYGRSPAGEVTSITNQTYTGTDNPANLVSNVVNGPNGPMSYQLGNGLRAAITYDALGRLNGRWVCNGSSQAGCTGGTQLYGFNVAQTGNQTVQSCDTVLNRCTSWNYDEFNRLSLQSVYVGTAQNFTYVYDRYGNRTQQNVTQGSGPAPTVSFDVTTNRINSSGYAYDAAGNLTCDGFHYYTYDAEGNILQVDNGATAQYGYDALNRRVRVVIGGPGGYTNGFQFDYAGRTTSTWSEGDNIGREGPIYWDGQLIAYHGYDGTTYFDHQDWVGTERMRTNYAGAVAATFSSLPFGDAYSKNINFTWADEDGLHFAQQQYDAESGTQHAQFRQYSSTQGRWMSPDPYDGSYNSLDPQSLNRYAYVENSPLSGTDPSGQCSTLILTSLDNYFWEAYSCDGEGSNVTNIHDYSNQTTTTTENTYSVPNLPSDQGTLGQGQGQGGGSATNMAPSKTNQLLQCASKTANQFSIAGVLGLTGEDGGIGSTIGTAFLGNTFSGIVDTGTHIYNNATAGGNGNQVVGDLVLGGGRQGIPGGGPFSAGVVGIATEAGLNAVSGPGVVLSGVTGTATSLAVEGTLGAEGLAGPAGWAKIGIDAAIFLGSALSCASK